MSDRIQGEVAKILSDRRMVITCGEDQDVTVGMRFAILSDSGMDIPNPANGEPLGTLRVAKTIVKVVTVEARYSIARTFRTVKSSGVFGNLTGPSERAETIRTDEPFAVDEIPDEDSVVRVGDTVWEVQGDEFEGLVLGF